MAQNAVNINAFTVHTKDVSSGQVIIWAREGTYSGFVNNPAGWTKIQDVIVSSGGNGTETTLPRLSLFYFMAAGSTHSFHVWSTLNLRYTNGIAGEGQPWTCLENPGDLIFYEGKGCHNQFACNYAPRVWNGKITYTIAASPTMMPTFTTLAPTNLPTLLPGFCADGSGRCTDTALGHSTTNLSECACFSTRRLQKVRRVEYKSVNAP